MWRRKRLYHLLGSLSTLALVVPMVAAGDASAAPLAAALASVAPARDTTEVASVLDDFHRAAAAADFDRYFGHFATDGVFLGTDPGERWTVTEFQDYARPYFDAGRGWTYRPTVRHIVLGPEGRIAWFDELLHNDSYGTTRGSGVVIHEGGRWRIALYDLSIPIPNPLAREVVDLIARDAEGARDADIDREADDAEGDPAVAAADDAVETDDTTEVRTALEAYYDALSDRDWPQFTKSFWSGATLTTVWQEPGTAGPAVSTSTVPEFVARAPEGPDSREIFDEHMLEADLRVEGSLATAWVRYRVRFGDPGDIAEWEGTDVVTLLQHDGVWRIVSLAFAPEG